jgi:hypothetical protein
MKKLECCLKCEVIAQWTETADETDCQVREMGMCPNAFTSRRVAQVNFDKGEPNGQHGISQSQAGVCVGAWVEEGDAFFLKPERMDMVNNCTLGVALEMGGSISCLVDSSGQPADDRLE